MKKEIEKDLEHLIRRSFVKAKERQDMTFIDMMDAIMDLLAEEGYNTQPYYQMLAETYSHTPPYVWKD